MYKCKIISLFFWNERHTKNKTKLRWTAHTRRETQTGSIPLKTLTSAMSACLHKETIQYQQIILTAAPPQRNFLISTNYLFLSRKHWTIGDKKGIGQLAMLNDYKTNKTFPWNTTYKKSSEIGNVSLNGPFIYKYAYMWTKCNDRQWNTNSVQNPQLNIFYNIMCKHWPWCNA